MLRERLHAITEQLPPEAHAGSIEGLRAEIGHSIAPQPSQHDPARYTCAVHAFHLTEEPGYVQVASFGLGTTYAGPDFIAFLLKNSLLEPREQTALSTGDLVLYFDEGTFKHIGRLIEPSRALSKWGTGGLYEHGLWEVPSTYGNELRFFVGPSEEASYELFVKYAESRGFNFGPT